MPFLAYIVSAAITLLMIIYTLIFFSKLRRHNAIRLRKA